MVSNGEERRVTRTPSLTVFCVLRNLRASDAYHPYLILLKGLARIPRPVKIALILSSLFQNAADACYLAVCPAIPSRLPLLGHVFAGLLLRGAGGTKEFYFQQVRNL